MMLLEESLGKDGCFHVHKECLEYGLFPVWDLIPGCVEAKQSLKPGIWEYHEDWEHEHS